MVSQDTVQISCLRLLVCWQQSPVLFVTRWGLGCGSRGPERWLRLRRSGHIAIPSIIYRDPSLKIRNAALSQIRLPSMVEDTSVNCQAGRGICCGSVFNSLTLRGRTCTEKLDVEMPELCRHLSVSSISCIYYI